MMAERYPLKSKTSREHKDTKQWEHYNSTVFPFIPKIHYMVNELSRATLKCCKSNKYFNRKTNTILSNKEKELEM